MHVLIPMPDNPQDLATLRQIVSNTAGEHAEIIPVALTMDNNTVPMDAAEEFYREELPHKAAMRGLKIRAWDDLTLADQEAFATDLGLHSEWLFPDSGPMYYSPEPDILESITF